MDSKIESWITPNPAVVETEEILVNAIQRMAEKQIGAILIIRDDKLSGIFTERDLLRLFSGNTEKAFKEYLLRPIKQFMTSEPICAQQDEDYNTVYMKTVDVISCKDSVACVPFDFAITNFQYDGILEVDPSVPCVLHI